MRASRFWEIRLRTYIWNDVDKDRCGIVPTALDSDFSFKKYAEYIYNSPAILTVNGDDIEFTADKKYAIFTKILLLTKA